MEQQIFIGIQSKLSGKMISNRRNLTGLEYCTANYTGPKTYEYLSEYRVLTGTELFSACNTVFVRGKITFPEEILINEEYEDCLFIRFYNLGGTIYIDGEPYSGIDENRDRIPLRAEWAGQTKELLIEGYVLNKNDSMDKVVPTCLSYAYMGRVDKVLEKYMWDLKHAHTLYRYYRENPLEDNVAVRMKLTVAFEESIRYLDLSLNGEELRDGVKHADKVFMEKLGQIDTGDTFAHFSLVASTHIDTAWLWQLKDTIRKCGHSYSNILRLLDSFPEFKFSHSQVKLLAYTKEYYPAIYEQIKVMVKAGRWENVGPMWVESDCNIVSGESLVRQILHGTAFLEKEFGERPRLAWLPDTFGFQPNIPQIFKKSGTDYFYSYKLHWQTKEKFPYGDFRWKGIDGSEIIGAVINNPAGGYNGFPDPKQVMKTEKTFEQKGEADEIIFPYGFGDGGGGPTREMIQHAVRSKDFPGLPMCEISTAQEFFDRLEKIREKLPVWYGELYIQTHRGTLTTEAAAKRNNRRCEMLYQSLEKIAVMAMQHGAEPDWELLYQGWEKILVLQFHDILPGSSIAEVYEDSQVIYQEIFDTADTFLKKLGMQGQIAVSEEERMILCLTDLQDGIKVINTLSWNRDVLTTFRCPLEMCGETYKKLLITCGEGQMPCTMVKKGDMAEVTFLAKDVKALSWKEYQINVCEDMPCESGRTMDVFCDDDGIIVNNQRYLVRIDNRGRILSLWDKVAEKQVLSAPGNDIKVFLDGPSLEDAWNIYENYKNREVEIWDKTHVEMAENNDLRTVIRVHNEGKETKLQQNIIFWQDKARIDFQTCVDWQEEHKVMRVYFPTTMNAPYFTSETGFGAYVRPTVGNTKLEKSKFEVAAHRFTDISESNYGVALLNDSKYGHDAQYNILGITLLRSTDYPASYPDKGMQYFTYSLLPHEGSWSQAEVARAGIELNAEIHTISAVKQTLAGVSEESLIQCDNPNLVIDSIKKAENGTGIVVRIYETNGTSGQAVLDFGMPVGLVSECNLVEKKVAVPERTDNSICFSFAPYEIKSFILE